jgi:transposase
VILVPPGVRILLATQPVDFRKGMDSLAALVQQALRADPFAGEVFVFRAKRADMRAPLTKCATETAAG